MILRCYNCKEAWQAERKRACKDGRFRCAKCRSNFNSKLYNKTDKGKETAKRYVENNIDTVRARRRVASKLQDMRHPERKKERERRYRESAKGRESAKARSKRRYRRDPEWHKMLSRQRYHGQWEKALRKLFEKQEHCQLCGTRIYFCDTEEHKQNYSVDHMHPLARGGKGVDGNLQLFCISCNSFKGDRLFLPDNAGVLVGEPY